MTSTIETMARLPSYPSVKPVPSRPSSVRMRTMMLSRWVMRRTASETAVWRGMEMANASTAVIFTVHLYYKGEMRIGVLPGTFNPPTRAHLALAEAALEHVDRVIFVLPRVLPHKDLSGVSFEERLALIQAVAR